MQILNCDLKEGLMPYCTKLNLGVATLAVAGAAYASYKWMRKYRNEQLLLRAIAIKRRQRDVNTEAICAQLRGRRASEETEWATIINMSFEDLRTRLQEGRLKAAQALRAFQWRALQAQKKTNCVCEVIIDAMHQSETLDNIYEDGKQPKPPLFGIPVSIKECYFIKGHDATMGCARWVNCQVSEDALNVQLLKKAGAIPFVLTNVPQTMWSLACSNPVFDTTTNPHDPTRTCGGSSGGEGALIGMHGSPLGLGGDIGGSVRIPAHFCSLCSLKPTDGRLSVSGGIRLPCSGLTAITGTEGPMGVDVDSLAWFMRVLCSPACSAREDDPYVPPVPFNESMFSGEPDHRLTIGYYDDDGWMTPMPTCRRAVHLAKSVLEARGHRLVQVALPFNAREMRTLQSAFTAALFPDGGREIGETFAADVTHPIMEPLARFCQMPVWMKKLRGRLSRSSRLKSLYAGCESDTYELRARYATIQEYRGRFARFWRENGLDCMIGPAFVTPAVPAELAASGFAHLWWGTAFYNAMNFVAGVVPCTTVTAEDERRALAMTPSLTCCGAEDDYFWRKIRDCQAGTTGLPVGVQCIGLPFREEMCLRLMKELESGLKKS